MSFTARLFYSSFRHFALRFFFYYAADMTPYCRLRYDAAMLYALTMLADDADIDYSSFAAPLFTILRAPRPCSRRRPLALPFPI